jgi:phosphoribosylformylglycinamidine synthase
MTYKVTIRVTLRPSILDPQGKAARRALHQLGYEGVEEVRMGKYIELRIDAASEAAAADVAKDACTKLLANAVMEDFAFEIEALEPAV